jgi:flagellar hook-associated protein 3 FlgL
MRISTKEVFDSGSQAIMQGQVDLMKTQQQISSGRKFMSGADDPVAAANGLRLRQAVDINAQYQVNQKAALGTLSQAESVLGDIGNLLLDIRTSTLAAGNNNLLDTDRQNISQEIAGRLQQLIGYANSTDGAGSYLFGGYNDTTQPYSQTGTSVVYAGDQGSRGLQVSDSRVIDVSVNGAGVFNRVATGNGVFATSALGANGGTGAIDAGRVTSPAALLPGHSYQVVFGAGGTTYTLNDTTAAAVVSIGGVPQTNIAYNSVTGATLSFNGLQFTISGAPNAADKFNVVPTAVQSVFTTLQNLVTLLNTPVTVSNRAALNSGIADALTNIDHAFDNALSARTQVGVRMKEVETLQTVSSIHDISMKTALSNIEDVDYADAASRLARQQMVLEAAQKSFVSVTHLTLFNFI